MDAGSSRRGWLLPLLGLAALAVIAQAWLPREATLPEEAVQGQDRLRGTWLREYTDNGVQVRRVLELGGDGHFEENVRIAEAGGRITHMVHQGTWLYDGTNLKRRYTAMNGEPSRLNVPFATFELAFRSRDDFVGVDHVHGVRIEYRRVPQDTLP